MFLLIAQRLVMDFFWDIAYFPLWWYSAGLLRALRGSLSFFATGNTMLVPGLWMRYLFVPMFGQTDWQGRVLSFFVRLVNIVVRSFLLLVWALICTGVFALWLLAPVAIAVMLARPSAL